MEEENAAKKPRTDAATWEKEWLKRCDRAGTGFAGRKTENGNLLIGNQYLLVNCLGEDKALKLDGNIPLLYGCKKIASLAKHTSLACKDSRDVFADFGNGYVYEVPMAEMVDGMVTFNNFWEREGFLAYILARMKGSGQVSETSGLEKKCILTAEQHPAGSGKTYRLCKGTIDDAKEGTHDTVLFLTKCHAQKETAKKQFQELLEEEKSNSGLDHSIFEGSKHTTYQVGGGRKVVFATIDSFIFNSTEDRVHGPEFFASLVDTIVQHYPTKIHPRTNTIRYAGQCMQVDKRMLVLVDEATMIEERYAKALIKMMEKFNIDVTLSGDVLQSTFFSKNALTYILQQPELSDGVEFVRNEGNEIRRFGNVEKYNYLPEDILIVSPFVTLKSEIGRVLNGLLERMEKFWEEKSNDENYEHHKLLAGRHSREEGWSAALHRRDEGGSIKLEESVDKVRMVSIHASQGDGRKCVYAVGLSEAALRNYSGSINSQYASLLNVAITRMEEVVRVFIEPCVDDIYRRFQKYITTQLDKAFPKKLPRLKMDIDLKELDHTHMDSKLYDEIRCLAEHGCAQGGRTSNETVDMQHHMIRMGTVHTVICAKLASLGHSTQLRAILHKIKRLPIRKKTYKAYFEEIAKKEEFECIPVLNYDTARQQRKDLVDSLVTRIHKVKRCIETWEKSNAAGLGLFKDLDPADMVVFHHLMCLMTIHTRFEITPRDVYDVIKKDKCLKDHYDYLRLIEAKIDKVFIGNDKWLIMRRESLGFHAFKDESEERCEGGRNDGCPDGAILTREAALKKDLAYVKVTEGLGVVIVPCVSLDAVRLPETCAKILAHTLCCKWPYYVDSDSKKVYDYLGKNARIKVCFLPLAKEQNPETVDVFDILDEHRKEVADTIVNFVGSKMEAALSEVCMLMGQFGMSTVKNKLEEGKHKPFPFLLKGIEEFTRQARKRKIVNTPAVNTPATSTSVVPKSFPDTVKLIREKMVDALDEVRQRVQGQVEDIMYT